EDAKELQQGNRVARRLAGVEVGLLTHQERLVVVGGPEVAARGIREVGVEHALERERLVEVVRLAGGLEEVEETGGEEGIVLEVAVTAGHAVAQASREAAVVRRAQDDGGGPARPIRGRPLRGSPR